MVIPDLLSELYKLLERFVLDNYDIEKLDYFAGLDVRGFYFAPVLAKTFGKGFIPVRKAKKVPRTNNDQIVTQSYDTEYSEDEFGLTVRTDEYKGKNVLILDDLLTTGESLIGASSVLKQALLNVVGAVTVYDVLDLRYTVNEKLELNGIVCKVLINNNHFFSELNDFAKLHYKIPDIVLKRINGSDESTNTKDISEEKFEDLNSSQLSNNSEHADKQFDDSIRKFTMTSDEWLSGVDVCDKYGNNTMSDIKVIYTAKDKELATKLLNVMNKEFGVDLDNSSFESNISSGLFSNGETRMEINTNVRNKHVVVVSQVRTGNINTDLIELFMIMDALQRANSEKITVVLPYYPYSRSDKKDSPRCAIGAAVVANIF